MLAQKVVRLCQETEEITRSNCEVCPSKMFLYGKLIVGWIRTNVSPHMGHPRPLDDYEFLRLITPQHGCYLQITFTI